ncbi:MAG TPA: TonB-dependent receptor [Gammaproteobacteria bacterium]|nr:TonB-dependent receptor [Gammaproteobacteria bacterium]
MTPASVAARSARKLPAVGAAGVAALSLALLGTLPVRADNAVQLGAVVVTDTGVPTPLRILPGNTTRVDSTSLALLDETHPSQLFTTIPGAWMTEGSGQESLMAIRSPLFTGAGACGAFLLLEDGIPIQPAGFCNVNAMFWLNTEQARALEVVRGPGSVLYGSNALNGIVNVLTQSAASDPGKRVSLERGGNNFLRMKLGLSSQEGNSGWHVAANATHDGGFRAESGYDQQKLTLRSDFDDGALSRESLLAVTNLNQQTAGYIHGLSAYRDESVRDSNPTPGAFRDSRSGLLAQKWRLHVSGTSEFDVTPYARRNTTDFTEHYLPGEPIEHDAANSLGTMLALRTSPSTETQVIYGLDTEYAHGSLSEFQPAAITGLPPAQADIRPQGLHYDYAVDSRTLAAYVHVTHVWNPYWLFSGGLRTETVRYSYVNALPVGNARADGSSCPYGGCLFNRPADRTDQFTNVLPKFGVSYLVNDRQTLYLNAGRGARAPEAAELYELQRQQTVADLNSETLNAYELGWRGRSARWGWDADLYSMFKSHFIFRDANGFNVSDGRIRSRGLEFTLDYRFNHAWSVLADGSYALHKYAFSAALGQGNAIVYGNDVKYAPRSLGGLRLRWQPSDVMRTELQWTHVGGYWLDESNRHRYGGHDLLNFGMIYAFRNGWSLHLRLTNLADTAYAERADYSFGDYRYFPGDGREWYMGVETIF